MKKKNFLCMIIFLIGIALSAQPVSSITFQTTAHSNSHFTYKIIPSVKGTFCYDIFAGDHMIIHQPSIPGQPGNKGFQNKNDAIKVAELVVKKMGRHIMPPTVSVYEMDSLGIKY